MSHQGEHPIRAEVEFELGLSDLCEVCGVTEEHLFEFVQEGLLEPQGAEPAQWRFRSVSIRRVRRAQCLQRDLGVNVAGAALALELLDELEQLRNRLRQIEGQVDRERG